MRLVYHFLGYKSIETTQIYTHLTIIDLHKAYLKAHPSAQKGIGAKDKED